MTTLPLLAAALLAVAIPFAVYAVLPARVPAVERVPSTDGAAGAAPDTGSPLRFLVTARGLERLDRSLQLASLLPAWSVHRVLHAKLVATIAALGLGTVFVAADPTPWRVVVALVALVVAYLGPDAVVASRARERQDRIQRELPDALDQVTIAVEAGLGLETAIARAGRFGDGPLAEELTRTIQDMRVGFSRKEAWLALSARTDVADLRRFARAIMQADQYGVSVAHVVRTQAKELRLKRRQRAEEKAMKVPVKILFPLMFSILPVLFIVVLGPGVLNLLHVLGTL